jgi:methyl-accepting chemotaxis protein
MTGDRNNRKLKHYLIRKDIQLRMLVLNLIYMLCSTLAIIAVVLYPVIALMYQSPFMEVQYHASRFFLLIAGRLPLVLVVFFILFSIHHMIMTHKIFGPLTNFSTTFHKLMQGDLTRKVHLRKSDYLKQEASDINRMIDVLTNALARIKEENEALRSVLMRMAVKAPEGEEGTVGENALRAALQQSEKIGQLMAQFKIDRMADVGPSGA